METPVERSLRQADIWATSAAAAAYRLGYEDGQRDAELPEDVDSKVLLARLEEGDDE